MMPLSRSFARSIPSNVISARRGVYALHGIFNRAQVDREPVTANISELHSHSIKLMGFILHPEDPRWRLVFQRQRVNQEYGISDHDFHVAWLSRYASPEPSVNSKYPSVNAGTNYLQVARALSNIELGKSFAERLKKVPSVNGYEIRFEKTKSVANHPDKRGVMGCPVGLWQLLLFEKENEDAPTKYISRIAFNFHRERGKTIVTVAGVQGAKGQNEKIESATVALEVRPEAFLINTLKTLLGNEVVYRGVKNPPQMKQMYANAYRQTRIRELFPVRPHTP